MKHHLNTLFVNTQGAWLVKHGQAVVVRVDRRAVLRVPLHNLGGVVCFGRVSATPALLATCVQSGVAVSYMTEHGRFLARVSGFTPGNVLLRRRQYRLADDLAGDALAIARQMVLAKVTNDRAVLLRFGRDYPDLSQRGAVDAAAADLLIRLADIEQSPDLDALRGQEGMAASGYFRAFRNLIVVPDTSFTFAGRSRRPPMDPTNALLSFLYSMLAHDCRSACEAAGLDPAVGFLHRDRPGRPGLALDLMEELRPLLADRLALALINRRQVTPEGFTRTEAGGVYMNDVTRKAVIVAYQKRKQEEILHPFLGERVTVGLLPHLQARLLARRIRGDLDAYPGFLWR